MSTTPTPAALEAAAFGLAYHDHRIKQIQAVLALRKTLARIDPSTGEPVWTKAELADHTGISRQAVSQLNQAAGAILERGRLNGYVSADGQLQLRDDVA